MPSCTYYMLPPASNAKTHSTTTSSTPSYTNGFLPPTPPYTSYPDYQDEDEDMDFTEETVDDLVNQWWFTNPAPTDFNDNSNSNSNSNILHQQGKGAETHVLSSANSPALNSPLSSTSLDNNFEGLCEFPFYSNSNDKVVNSPDCIAIAAASSTEPSTPLTDTSGAIVSIKKEPPTSPPFPAVPQGRGPGRPRKNASALRVDTSNAASADSHSTKRKRHSQIERRYRCRLQAGMDSLGEVLPSTSKRDRDSGETCDSPTTAAGPRSRKASILIDAREYILELETDKRLLAAENDSLKAEISRMKRHRMKENNYYAS